MRFCEIELLPAMKDPCGIDFSDTHEDSLFQLLKAPHADSFQECSSHFPEQGLNQNSAGAVFGGMDVHKAVRSCR